MAKSPLPSESVPPPAKWAVYFDFDNTLTSFDVLDDIISRFSVSRDWMTLEAAWKAGHIDTRSCLDGQLRGLRVAPIDLERYLSSVELDPHFLPIVRLLRGHGISPVILSDSFTYFINFVLTNHGLSDITVFANEVIPSGDVWIPSFPFHGNG
jgi:2-hydroxy-3-keto-5-methylthiopentenyl-1-phosphate phosphatase